MMASQVNKRMIHELCAEMKSTYKFVRYIDVKIEDINGPHKAGIDKRCHLKVRGKDHLAIDISDMDDDITCAIDKAFCHLKELLEHYHSCQARLRSYGINSNRMIEAT